MLLRDISQLNLWRKELNRFRRGVEDRECHSYAVAVLSGRSDANAQRFALPMWHCITLSAEGIIVGVVRYMFVPAVRQFRRVDALVFFNQKSRMAAGNQQPMRRLVPKHIIDG